MTTAARLVAVLAVLTAFALLQSALCSDGAAAAGAPCAPLFASEPAHSLVSAPADDCSSTTTLGDPADAPSPAGHLDDVAGICVALLVALVLLARLRRPFEATGPPRPASAPPARKHSATSSLLVQLCVSRT